MSLSRSYPERPWIGVLAAVRRGPRCLLIQRAQRVDQGKWGFPGGTLELGETVTDCAERELREETGVEAQAVGVLTAYDYIGRDAEDRVRFHYTLVCVALDWHAGEGEVREPEIHSGIGWFTPEDVEAKALSTSDRAVELMRRALSFSAAI
ncbi:MAG TPA: NUDIX domain-containing protein [Stellaceae bacterium]|nr:NUDIX domain-containing protein [Stellaceae bacterium]